MVLGPKVGTMIRGAVKLSRGCDTEALFSSSFGAFEIFGFGLGRCKDVRWATRRLHGRMLTYLSPRTETLTQD